MPWTFARSTPCCSCRSEARSTPRTSSRSSRTSPPDAASRASGWSRSASTTSSSAASRRSTSSTASSSSAIGKDFAENDIDLPIYWGNRNWGPYLRDAVRQMADDGITNAAYFVTSAYSSYSGCRQYREDLSRRTLRVRRRAHQASSLLQPPRLRDAVRGRHQGCARRGAGRDARRLRHALDPRCDERRQRRAGPARLPTSARGDRVAGGRRCGDGTLQPGLLLEVRVTAREVARARHQRPPAGSRRPGRHVRGRGADRVRLRPHGGHLRPRHRGRGHGEEARAALRARRHARRPPRVHRDGPRSRPGASRGRTG